MLRPAQIQVYLTYSNMIIHGIFPLLFLVIVNSKIYFRWHIFLFRRYHIFVAVVLNKPHDLLTSATFKIASLLPDIYSYLLMESIKLPESVLFAQSSRGERYAIRRYAFSTF